MDPTDTYAGGRRSGNSNFLRALITAFAGSSAAPQLDAWGRPPAVGLEQLIDARSRGAHVRLLSPAAARRAARVVRPAGAKLAREVAERRLGVRGRGRG